MEKKREDDIVKRLALDWINTIIPFINFVSSRNFYASIYQLSEQDMSWFYTRQNMHTL